PRVALPALPAARDEQRLPVSQEIAELFAGFVVGHGGADRHRHVEVIAAAAGAVVARTALAALRTKRALDAKVRQRVDAFGCAQIHAAAEAAITAIRPAEGHELLAPEADAATPAVAGVDVEASFVDELHGGWLSKQ